MLNKTPKKDLTKIDKVVAPRQVQIKPPKFEYGTVVIRGTAPLVLNAFSQKARNAIIETQQEGSRSRKGKQREAKNFDAVYQGARHIDVKEGWDGLPASAIRNGMISACKLVGFAMTRAKLSVFVEADGFDENGTPLVKISKGAPEMHLMHARPESGGVDIRARPMWKPGWEAKLRLRWDSDQFSAADVMNLLMRVGMQGGIGEGRPDSKKSSGLGWGLFELVQ